MEPSGGFLASLWNFICFSVAVLIMQNGRNRACAVSCSSNFYQRISLGCCSDCLLVCFSTKSAIFLQKNWKSVDHLVVKHCKKGLLTSNLEMRRLWGPVDRKKKLKHSVNLLAVTVGIKQKELVKEIVQKFLANDFVVMLFHYDGIVDEWNDFEWSGRVIHVSATNQTKWWFAKRFLHPDIVSEYDYIFLWDEDLGVENFHPGRYLSIVEEEGLEISQPALDPAKSEVHHQITVRRGKSRVHMLDGLFISKMIKDKCGENGFLLAPSLLCMEKNLFCPENLNE